MENKEFNSKNAEQNIINLSEQKWLWIANKNVDALSVFIHMGGSWGKERKSIS